eukprot:TRINITY_DN10675_c0_g1_i1.p1 TRINITY_DN10675_c0_g1~~TRINITY_DN10675_c0_g1_i1.p1  ORF type:complete len:445 (+),score=81.80 TRINITY_DN10675_c0_g1_i1:125-1459(+)
MSAPVNNNYFLISVPIAAHSTHAKMKTDLEYAIRSGGDENKVWEFDIPKEHFRAGNIDSLIYLSDTLKKTVTSVESTLKKVTTQLSELHQKSKEDYRKTGAGAPEEKKDVKPVFKVNLAKPEEFLTRFKWNDSRFSGKKKSLGDLVTIIKGEVLKTEKSMRDRSLEYNTICSKTDQIAANESGNLITRDINSVIKEYNSKRGTAPEFKPVEEKIPDDTAAMLNDYNSTVSQAQHYQFSLATLYVVIPKNEMKNWIKGYESLLDAEKSQFVVPGSSVKLAEDNDTVLNSVVVFNKDVEAFKTVCRNKRYTVRKNDPSTVIPDTEKKALLAQKQTIQGLFFRESENNFADVFQCWLHLKCIQCYVESLLRYGPLPDFVAFLILPKKSHEKKLIKVLCNHYSYLGDGFNDREDTADVAAASEEKLGLGSHEKYFPFVFSEINLGLVE